MSISRNGCSIEVIGVAWGVLHGEFLTNRKISEQTPKRRRLRIGPGCEVLEPGPIKNGLDGMMGLKGLIIPSTG